MSWVPPPRRIIDLGELMVVNIKEKQRDLVALNADVVGFSRLLADDAESTTSALEDYRQLVEGRIIENDGELVDFVGDSFMAVFDDAKDAMAASIAISSDVEARNTDLPAHRRVRFRMGLDQGQVTITEHQFLGDALNIASRIQSLAKPGGVSVSARVYQALDEPSLRFRPQGRKVLKNIPGSVEVYEFADLPSDGTLGTPNRRIALQTPTIAVLAFHTETLGEEIRPLADLLRSDLLHRLSSVPRLGVIDAALGSSEATPSTMYLLEAGVIKAGGQLRVYAKVIQLATMNIVTSHRWTSKVDELIDMSDAISDEIASAIEVELVIGEPARLYAELDDPEAIKKIYQGWYELTTSTPQSWRRAVDIFSEVAASHPETPVGRVLDAFALWLGASEGLTDEPEKAFKLAYERASAAIETTGDPTGLAHMVVAAVKLSQGLHDEALDIIEQAEITRPTCDVTFAVEGSVRRYLGQWEKSVDLMDTAMRLATVNPPWYPTVQACSLFDGGRLENALATAEAVIEHQPNNLEALLVLAATQVELGMDNRSRATADLIRDRFPSVDLERWLKRSPYRDPATTERWHRDLAKAGLLED